MAIPYLMKGNSKFELYNLIIVQKHWSILIISSLLTFFFFRTDEASLVYDMNPNPNEIKIGTRVIAHWSGLSAFLAGNVTKIEGNKYHVLYDDGDRGINRLEQMRILKPPLFFGKEILLLFYKKYSY